MGGRSLMAKLKLGYPSLRQPARVTFGRGAIKEIAKVEEPEDAAFFISGRTDVRALVDAAFEKQGVDLHRLRLCSKPPGEPSPEMIDLGARFLGSRAPRRIVGIGGGSVMDWCRLAWAQHQGLLSVSSGKMAAPVPDEPRPRFWLVPTTCATGAEAAAVAVFSAGGRKMAVVSDAFVAEHVVLDGQFLDQMTPQDVANFLADTLSHAVESYCSIVSHTLAKEAAVSALWLVKEHGDGEPTSCRAERLMEAGYLGGLAAAHCSVGVVHAFAHTISRFGVAHAHANAVGLEAGLAVNAEAPALSALARRVGVKDSQAMLEVVAPIIARAIGGRDHRTLIAVISDPQHRGEIVSGMQTDVCMRTNPIPLDESRLHDFLDRVVEVMRRA